MKTQEIPEFIEEHRAVFPSTVVKLEKEVVGLGGDLTIKVNNHDYTRKDGVWTCLKRTRNPEWLTAYQQVGLRCRIDGSLDVHCQFQNKDPWVKIVRPALNKLCHEVFGRSLTNDGITTHVVDEHVWGVGAYPRYILAPEKDRFIRA